MQKLETQTDYWLAQYQRLLDSKPQCLIDQVIPTHLLVLVVVGCLGGAAVRRQTHDRKVASLTPVRGAIKSSRSTQPSVPPG